MGIMTIDEEIRAVINAPDTSHWLRQALNSALERDSIDAANDADFLSDLLGRRYSACLQIATKEADG
jgi:hypothetical protein